ncbi:MAG: hypothetical protein EON60_05895 [Alphaproteobacteria bacterium]|nr:MAG: hypothetical protein EON60_05895 [Alphaproteobacteria bacterium]
MKMLASLFVFLVLITLPVSLWATTAPAVGDAELKLLNMVFTGYIGYIVAFLVVIMGAFTFATSSQKFGIALMFLGVIITLLPMVFNATRSLVCPAVTTFLGGTCH